MNESNDWRFVCLWIYHHHHQTIVRIYKVWSDDKPCIIYSTQQHISDLRWDENSIRFVSNNDNNEMCMILLFCCWWSNTKKSILLCIMKSSKRTWMKHNNNKSSISILVWYRKQMCNEMLQLVHIKTNWRW